MDSGFQESGHPSGADGYKSVVRGVPWVMPSNVRYKLRSETFCWITLGSPGEKGNASRSALALLLRGKQKEDNYPTVPSITSYVHLPAFDLTRTKLWPDIRTLMLEMLLGFKHK